MLRVDRSLLWPVWARRLVQFFVAFASGVVAFLTFFRPPESFSWFLRLGVTEWGYWLAPLIAVPLLRPLRRGLGWSAWLLGVAALLAQLPLLQAAIIARTLPAQLTAAFGHGAASQTMPFNMRGLVRGRGANISYQRYTYAERNGQALVVDFYRPSASATAPPLVVVVHGGSWQSGDSQQLPALNSYLAEQGYAVASITYRLAPQHRFPAAQDDLAAALDYLAAHAAELEVDATRMVLLGRSAGAQIVLLGAYTLHNPAIRGVIGFYGPTDMVWGYNHPANPLVIDTHGVLEAYLGGSPATVPLVYRDASPTEFVHAGSPPTLLLHGGKDEMVFLDNSRQLAERLQAANRPHLLVELPWASHACDANIAGPCGQISTYAIEHFLDAVVK